jgi:hypothetical protein
MRILKKSTIIAAVALLAVAMCFGSCSDDKSSSNPKAQMAAFIFHFDVSSDLLEVADITITYKNADGKVTTTALTTDTWEKSTTLSSFPATAGYKVTVTRKSNELSKSTYTIGYNYTNEAAAAASANVFYGYLRDANSVIRTIPKDSVDSYVSRISASTNFGYQVSSDESGYSSVKTSITF